MEYRLDVSEQEPPEPLENILANLENLAEGDWLRVQHSREPYPLYSLLREMDFAWKTQWQNGVCIIQIWHAGYPPSEQSG